MIRRAVGTALLAAACLGTPRGADAQSRPEPQLLLTIHGGVASGPTLYTGLRQSLALIEDPTSIDTLQLGRRISPGITLGASATYFPKPSLALTADISFLGFGRDDTCELVYRDPSTARAGYSEQICDNIAATGGSASTMAFELGGVLRFAPRGVVKPYLRAQLGITTRNSSTVEVTGSFLDASLVRQTIVIIGDPDPASLDPTASFGAGIMIPFAPGYQARLEVRDRLMFVKRVTGPANALAEAPVEEKMFHSVGLVFMLDIVLEQRRGRRY